MGIASLLILNSHLEGVYPFSWMAADGLIGNVLFFVLSGYGLMVSQSKHPYNLSKFLRRRIIRIYPSLWIVMVLAWLTGLLMLQGDRSYLLKVFVWPTEYGFIAHILPFYVVGWCLARSNHTIKRMTYWGSLAIWLLATFVCTTSLHDATSVALGSMPLYWWSAYFLFSFLTGSRLSEESNRNFQETNIWITGAKILTIFIVYVGLKFAFYRTSTPWIPVPLVGFMIQSLGLVFVTELVSLKGSLNNLFKSLRVHSISIWIGRSSLQVYLCHVWVIMLTLKTSLYWPAKLLVIYLVSILSAYGLRIVVEKSENKAKDFFKLVE